MNPHLQSVRSLEDDFAEAMTHMYAVGNDLARLRAQMERATAAPVAHAQPAPPQSAPAAPPVPQPGPMPTPASHMPEPRPATPAGPVGPGVPFGRPPVDTPWWQREGAIAKLLAVAGAGVTLIGVAMLVTLAVQNGWFGPVARVAAGAALAVGLLLIAFRVHAEPRRATAAVAIAATGYAAAYLDVLAVTVIYEWVPPLAGLALAGVIGAAGLVHARRWDSQLLALITVLGALLLAPPVGAERSGVLTATFMLVLTVASQPAHIGKFWPGLHIARTAPTALMILGGGVVEAADRPAYLVLAGILALFDLGTTFAANRHRMSRSVVAPFLVVSTLPVVVLAHTQERWTATALLVGVAAAHLVAAVLARGEAEDQLDAALSLRPVATVIGTFVAFLAVLEGTTSTWVGTGVLALAVAYAACAAVTKSRLVTAVAGMLTVLGGFIYLDIIGAVLSRWVAVRELGVAQVVESVLTLALVLVLVIGVGRILPRNVRPFVTAGAWLLGLLASTGLTVSAGVVLGDPLDAADSGFIAGHAVATVLWLGSAAYLLMHGLKRAQDSSLALRTGLLLAAIGVGKLVLFDLGALDGIIRVVAFLVAGVLLLAMGAGYANALDKARRGNASL